MHTILSVTAVKIPVFRGYDGLLYAYFRYTFFLLYAIMWTQVQDSHFEGSRRMRSNKKLIQTEEFLFIVLGNTYFLNLNACSANFYPTLIERG